MAQNHKTPAVVHMSVEGAYSAVVNNAVERLISNHNLHVVVSSGDRLSHQCCFWCVPACVVSHARPPNHPKTQTINPTFPLTPAGNSALDACRVSPGSAASAVTVAAIDANRARWSYANWGACVDLFAPGVSILSAVPDSDTSAGLKTGTSMAARE